MRFARALRQSPSKGFLSPTLGLNSQSLQWQNNSYGSLWCRLDSAVHFHFEATYAGAVQTCWWVAHPWCLQFLQGKDMTLFLFVPFFLSLISTTVWVRLQNIWKENPYFSHVHPPGISMWCKALARLGGQKDKCSCVSQQNILCG